MTSQPILQYLENKNKRESTLFKIISGKGFYVLNGQMIPAIEFEKQHPLAPKVRTFGTNYKGESPDGRQIK